MNTKTYTIFSVTKDRFEIDAKYEVDTEIGALKHILNLVGDSERKVKKVVVVDYKTMTMKELVLNLNGFELKLVDKEIPGPPPTPIQEQAPFEF